jgi:hypothetical protein
LNDKLKVPLIHLLMFQQLMLNCAENLHQLLQNQESVLGEECSHYYRSPNTPPIKNIYPFLTAFPRRPAGIVDGTTLPGPAGLEVSFLPSTGIDIGAAARDPLFILHLPRLCCAGYTS